MKQFLTVKNVRMKQTNELNIEKKSQAVMSSIYVCVNTRGRAINAIQNVRNYEY